MQIYTMPQIHSADLYVFGNRLIRFDMVFFCTCISPRSLLSKVRLEHRQKSGW